MADTVVTTKELQIKCTLQDSEGAQVARTIAVENPNTKANNIGKLRALATALVTDRNKFVQPGSWRDEDEDEGAYTTTGVEFTEVETTKITYDVGNLWISVNSAYRGDELFEQGFTIFDSAKQVASIVLNGYAFEDLTISGMTATRSGDFILVRFDYSGTATAGTEEGEFTISCKNAESTELITAQTTTNNITLSAELLLTATVTA